LAENAGLAFVGERLAAAARIPPQLAERMLESRNPHGKPNADVVRRLVTATDPRRPGFHWQIDFPAEMSEREASLYEQPFHHLFRTLRPKRDGWWRNAHADQALRAALARRERYLAAPIDSEPPAFAWFDATIIPDETLLAVARDDDFIYGILQSRVFASWWHRMHSCRSPTLAFESFPFPWPPGTPLHALSAVQEEQRHAVARAVRAGDNARLHEVVSAAYGWPADLDADVWLDQLSQLNASRAG
jgi:hypothetical protein